MEFFRSAKPIFIKDKSLEMNFQAGFVCEFDAEAGKKYALSSTGSTFYRVTLNGSYTKPSREIKPGDTVTVRKTLVTYSFRVLALVSSRQGAKNVPEYMEDITPPEELNKLNVPRETIFVQRDRGMGRPTKRERREIDALMGDLSYSDEEE